MTADVASVRSCAQAGSSTGRDGLTFDITLLSGRKIHEQMALYADVGVTRILFVMKSEPPAPMRKRQQPLAERVL